MPHDPLVSRVTRRAMTCFVTAVLALGATRTVFAATVEKRPTNSTDTSRQIGDVRLPDSSLAAGVNVFGRALETPPRQAIETAFEAYPRLGFKAAFDELLGYCRHKPDYSLFTSTDSLTRCMAFRCRPRAASSPPPLSPTDSQGDAHGSA